MSREPPRLSVVVAARDMAAFIGDTLDSVAAQTVADHEVIVVDDGSRDGTGALVARRAATDMRVVVLQGPCRGVGAARNLGAAHARAPAILFLDADDLLRADAAQRLLAALDARPQAPAACGHHRRIAEDGTPIDPDAARFAFPASETLAALLAKNFVVNGGSLAIRSAAFGRAGAYREDLAYGEDWELWCRLALLGDFAIDDGPPVLLYRQRAAGANYRARISPLARHVPCIDVLARHAGMRARLGSRLDRLLRARRIDVFWAGVRSEFQFGSRTKALGLAACGAALYPDSLLRPQLALRFVRSMLG